MYLGYIKVIIKLFLLLKCETLHTVSKVAALLGSHKFQRVYQVHIKVKVSCHLDRHTKAKAYFAIHFPCGNSEM